MPIRTTINPKTGRSITIGGALFCRLTYEAYDFINGSLIRRDTAPPLETRRFVHNVATDRSILVGGRQYNSYIRAGWQLDENESILYPPEDTHTNYNTHDPQRNMNFPTTYEEIMAVHREKLLDLNLTLCRECFIAINIEEGEYCREHKPSY
nr:9113_t:CDS:1 [Entrophospora candida]